MAAITMDDVTTSGLPNADTQGQGGGQLDGGEYGRQQEDEVHDQSINAQPLKTSLCKRLVNFMRRRNKIKFNKVFWQKGNKGPDKAEGELRGLKKLAKSLGRKLRRKGPNEEPDQLCVSSNDAKSPRGSSQKQFRTSSAATGGSKIHGSEHPDPLASHPVTATGGGYASRTLDPI